MLLSIENYNPSIPANDDITKLFFQEYSPENKKHMINSSPPLQLQHSLLQESDPTDLIKTDNPAVWCSRLPDHYRSNKSLPNTFAVFIQDYSVPNGTQVVIQAGNSDNPTSLVRNNTAVVAGCVDGLGKVAKFSDLRFVGRSGRGKYFSVTITIMSEPKIVATYHKAIKVTVDGPRTSRKVAMGNNGMSGHGRVKHYSGNSGDMSSSSPESSICQSPDQSISRQFSMSPPLPTNHRLESHTGSPTRQRLQGVAAFSSRYQPYMPPLITPSAKSEDSTSPIQQYYSFQQQGYLPTANPTPAPILQETSVTTRCISYHPHHQYMNQQPPPPYNADLYSYSLPDSTALNQQTYYYQQSPNNVFASQFEYRQNSSNTPEYFPSALDSKLYSPVETLSAARSEPSLFEHGSVFSLPPTSDALQLQQNFTNLPHLSFEPRPESMPYEPRPESMPQSNEETGSVSGQMSQLTQLWRPY